MQIGELCLVTQDVQRLSTFYQETLETSSDGNSEHHQVILLEGTAFTILRGAGATLPGNQNMFLAFTVEDVDKEYQRLKKAGVTIVSEPTVQPWGAKNMIFLDPDGNSVVFRTFLQAKNEP